MTNLRFLFLWGGEKKKKNSKKQELEFRTLLKMSGRDIMHCSSEKKSIES